MVSVMNKLHCHKKIVAYFLDKNSQMAMICYNYKINNLQITLYTSGNVLDNCWCFKGVLKNFTNFARKHLCQIKCDPESLIYLCSLHLHYKETPAHSCFSVSSAEFLRILFFYLLTLYSTFKSNKYMKVSFLLTVFHRKNKIKQKSRVALKLGNLRFTSQRSSSFVELLLSSC